MNPMRGLCVLTAAVLLAACSSAESDWNQANTTGTVAAYQDFISKHPDDPNAAQARQHIQTLQDAQAWAAAQQANTVEGYQGYLTAQPSGAHGQEAHDKMMAMQRAAAWQTAQAAGTEAALQGFLQTYSQGPEADQARAMLATLNFRVQLGAFSSSAAAEKARASLQDKYGKELQMVMVEQPMGKSKTYHVSSAAMTEQQAKAACAAVRKTHPCQAVKIAAEMKM